jgi:hypothetical protein
LNHQNLNIERYRVRAADHPTSKSQPPRAKAPRGRDFARACHDGPIAFVRHTAVFFAFAAALSLTNCKGLLREMWERAMRTGIVAGCVALALLVGGCDTNDSRFFRYGIGTNLYSEDIVQATQYQDIYLTELCRQAVPMLVTTESVCVNAGLTQNDWDLIVQAGLNDIDRRCDAYLAWLDDRKRTNNAVLKQIGDTLSVSQGIMRLSGVGADPITMAGLAFGFATNTFTNVNSRLLLEVDKTTVQTLVLRRRGDYRLQLRDVRVQNKPAVVHALRSYLNICTPYTIETDINSTITVFQQVGASGLDRRGPLVSPETVGAPVRATQTIVPPSRPAIVPSPFAAFFEETLSKTEGERTLNGLCFNKISSSSAEGRKALASYLVRVYQQDENLPVGGQLTKRDREIITKQQDCGIAQNYFEKKTFANVTSDQARLTSAAALKAFVRLLNRSSAGGQIAPDATLADARAKIKAVRSDTQIAAKFTFEVPEDLKTQVTPDMPVALRSLPQN